MFLKHSLFRQLYPLFLQELLILYSTPVLLKPLQLLSFILFLITPIILCSIQKALVIIRSIVIRCSYFLPLIMMDPLFGK